MTVQKGLNNILGGTEFLAFEAGKPKTLLFVDWNEDVYAVKEFYDKSLNPSYIRTPGKDVCPYWKMNPDKYPQTKVKFRVYDAEDEKVKLVSMSKTHVKKLNTEFNLEEIDPRETFVTIYRTGSGPSDTAYSARTAKNPPEKPNFEELDMPDIQEQVRPHTPEEIQGFIDAVLNAGSGQSNQANDTSASGQQPQGRNKLPF